MWFKQHCLFTTQEKSANKSGFGSYLGKIIFKNASTSVIRCIQCPQNLVWYAWYSRLTIAHQLLICTTAQHFVYRQRSGFCVTREKICLYIYIHTQICVCIYIKQDYSYLVQEGIFLCMKIDSRLYVDYGLLISKQKIAQYILFVPFTHSKASSLRLIQISYEGAQAFS